MNSVSLLLNKSSFSSFSLYSNIFSQKNTHFSFISTLLGIWYTNFASFLFSEQLKKILS